MNKPIDYTKVAPYCRRCGYKYDPRIPKVSVMIMPSHDGKVYAACAKCLEDLGKVPEHEKSSFIDSFRVVDN